MTRFLFARHGETDWNAQGRIQGSTDVPLNDVGRGQAVELAHRLEGTRWHAVVTSPLSRARETADIIAERLGAAPPIEAAGFAERTYGEAEGTLWSDFAHTFDCAPPIGIESRASMARRAHQTIDTLAAAHPGGSLLVVTHHGVIQLVAGMTDAENGSLAAAQLVDGRLDPLDVETWIRPH